MADSFYFPIERNTETVDQIWRSAPLAAPPGDALGRSFKGELCAELARERIIGVLISPLLRPELERERSPPIWREADPIEGIFLKGSRPMCAAS